MSQPLENFDVLDGLSHVASSTPFRKAYFVLCTFQRKQSSGSFNQNIRVEYHEDGFSEAIPYLHIDDSIQSSLLSYLALLSVAHYLGEILQIIGPLAPSR
jgi:hypothetical protein